MSYDVLARNGIWSCALFGLVLRSKLCVCCTTGYIIFLVFQMGIGSERELTCTRLPGCSDEEGVQTLHCFARSMRKLCRTAAPMDRWWGPEEAAQRSSLSLGLLVPVFTFRDPNLQEKYRVGLNRIAAQEVPIEIKLVNPPTLSQLQTLEPKQMFWVRARGYIGKRTHELEKNTPGVYLPLLLEYPTLPLGPFPNLSSAEFGCFSPEPLPFNMRIMR